MQRKNSVLQYRNAQLHLKISVNYL